MGMINRAQELKNKFTGMVPAPNVFRVATGPQKNANENAAFPVQLGSTDPEDQKWALREKIMTAPGPGGIGGLGGANGVIPGVGQVIADDSFFDYAKRKKDQEVLYDFYRFMMSNAKLDTPEAAQWWFGKFPWMRDLRLREIDKQAELQKALARIQVTGPESEEDFMLLFLIKNGTIALPDHPITQMGQSDQGIATSFQKGFFSPFSQPPYTSTPIGQGDANFGFNDRKVPFANPISSWKTAPWPRTNTIGETVQPTGWRNLLGLQ